MPFYTEKFKLPFFSRGEIYSASRDRQRFEIIDEELSALSSLIGSGIVKGMEVESISNESIIIKEGIFCIDGRMYVNSVDKTFNIESLGVNYLWAISGTDTSIVYGNISNIANLNYSDASAGVPINEVEFSSLSPYSVSIKIVDKLPADTKKIKIYKSTGNDFSNSIQIASLFYPEIEFLDEQVLPGYSYNYWFINEDVNGFVSDVSEKFMHASPEDLSIPNSPSGIKTYPAHRSIGITWNASVSKNVSYYVINCVQMDEMYEQTILAPITNAVFNNLKNGISAKISIVAVSLSNISSEPISVFSTPTFHPGARDADSLSAVFYPSSVDGMQKSSIRLTWANPYIDPALSDLSLGEQKEISGQYDIITKYQVWEIRNNGSISLQGEPTVAYSPNEIIFSYFQKKNANNQIVNENLKDNSNYFIKVTRVIDGLESLGRYVFVRTGDVTPPDAPFGILSSLQTDGSLDITWSLRNVSEVKKQKIIIESANILSTIYNFSNLTSSGFRFSALQSDPINEALFENRPPFRIGYVDGYFIFEPETDRIEAIKSLGVISGFGSIVDLEVISPPGGIYVSSAGLNVSSFKSNFLALSPVLKFTWSTGGLPKTRNISLANLFEFINLTGDDDDSTYFDKIIKTEPKSFSTDSSFLNAPDSVRFNILNSGVKFEDIPKEVTIGNYSLEISDELSQSTYYKLPISFVSANKRYKISIQSFDFSNNLSSMATSTYDTEPLWSVSPPNSPTFQVVSIEDGALKISWIPSFSDSLNGYEIMRAEIEDGGLTSFAAENNLLWKKIASLPNDINQYIDYSTESGKYYVYRVISIGLLNKKSPLFFGLNQNNETTSIKQSPAIETNSFIPKISISQNNNDIIISFENSDGFYDGYHIYRSFNYGEFKKIASINMSDSSYGYTDKSALILSGNYRYLVRPITTQSSFVITSDENYNNGLLLAQLITSINNIEIVNTSSSAILASASVKPELEERIEIHKHLMLDEENDLRVNLSSEYVFENFETDNNQRFLIIEELPSLPQKYNVKVLLNGNLSSINYEFLPQRQLLKFGTRLSPTSGNTQTNEPFAFLPSIKLIIDVSGETENELSEERLSSVFAQQISFGKINSQSMPLLSHSGPIGETMSAAECLAESVDGFKHIVTLNENRRYLIYNNLTSELSEISEFEYNDLTLSEGTLSKVGFPLNKSRHYMVHDAFNIPGTENFIFATNRGVYYYWQNGAVFNMDLLIASEPPQDSGPCHKIIYCDQARILLCLNFRSFDVIKVSKNGGVALLYAQQALDFNAHVFRDAVETSDGSVFVSSDIGIFRIRFNNFVNYQEDNRSFNGNVSNIKIEQVSLFSGSNTDVFALWTNEEKTIIYVSTGSGIFYSNNFGQSFVIDKEISKVPHLWSVINSQGTWFGVSENAIYRKRNNEAQFTRIYYNSNFVFRRISAKYGKLLVVTNDGLYSTESIVNCKYNESIDINPINIEVSENGSRKHLYSIANFGPYLIACLEGKTKLMYSLDRFAEHFDFSSSVTIFGIDDFPTVIVNNKKIGAGVYLQYSTDGKKDDCIFFDSFLPTGSDVRVIRQYSVFSNPSGGWARRDFASPCILYKNNNKLNDGSRANKPFNQIAYYSELQHELTDQVSNISELEINLEGLRQHAYKMMINETDADGNVLELGIHRFTRNNMRTLIDRIDQVNSKVYDDNDASSLGILSSLRVPYPQIEVNFVSNSLPGSYGVSKQMLNKLGITYTQYSEATFEGSLGTYDPEDPSYYLPEIPTVSPHAGVSAPNYEFDDLEAFGDDIGVIYSGYYGSNNAETTLGSFGGRRTSGGTGNGTDDGTIGGPGSGLGGGGGLGGGV